MGLARSVSTKSAKGTSLKVGTVSGALGLGTEWSNAPLASRTPYTLTGFRNFLPLRSMTATGRSRWRATPSMKLANLVPSVVLQ